MKTMARLKNRRKFAMRNIVYVGLLVSLFLNILSAYRIHSLEERMKINDQWMIVKKIRAELIEKRLDELEKVIKAAPDENKLSLDILGLYEEINELTVRDRILKKK